MQVNKQNINLMSLYDNANYLDLYGGSVIFTITIVTGFILSQLGSYTNDIFKDMRKDWDKKRCKPYYMPFAGYVKPHPYKSKTQVAIENFNDCMSGYSEGIFDNFRGPTNSLVSSLVKIKLANDIDNSKIEETIESEKQQTQKTQLDMIGIGKILLTGGQRMIVQFKYLFQKIEAMFLTSVFSITGSLNVMAGGLKAFHGIVTLIFTTVMIIIGIIISILIAAIVASFLSLAFPIAIKKLILLAIVLLILIGVAIPFGISEYMFSTILKGSDNMYPVYNKEKYRAGDPDGSRGVLDIIDEEENIKDKYMK